MEVYEYLPRMAHDKVAVVDGFWTTFGSSNLDARSLSDNDELNVIVLDADFAAGVEKTLFAPDLAASARISSYSPSLVQDGARAVSWLFSKKTASPQRP